MTNDLRAPLSNRWLFFRCGTPKMHPGVNWYWKRLLELPKNYHFSLELWFTGPFFVHLC